MFIRPASSPEETISSTRWSPACQLAAEKQWQHSRQTTVGSPTVFLDPLPHGRTE